MIDKTDIIEELETEIQEARKTFDIIDRLTERPKRKPQVVTVYLDEEKGEELGSARDIRDQHGTLVQRIREGILGELADLRDAEVPDEKKIKALERRAKKLVAEIKENSLTFTLQWIPPIAEEVIEKDALKAIGLRSKPVPDEKLGEFKTEYFARLLVDTLVQVQDNSSGSINQSLKIHEAQRLKELLPEAQFDRLDAALGKLQYHNAIHSEAVDNADF